MNAGNMENGDCILLLMRAPRLGEVKSRLSGFLHQELVLDLYRQFVLDTAETVAACEQNVLIFVDPPAAVEEVGHWLGDRFSYLGQEGKGLGERMANAFVCAFSRGFRRTILIGSDTPDLPRTILETSLEKLAKKDAVIGPSTDGGFYLIGFSIHQIPKDVFRLPVWGSDSVFSDTSAVLSARGYDFHVLPEWTDIDHLHDLARFVEDTDENPFGSRTRAWARQHRVILEEAYGLSRGHDAP